MANHLGLVRTSRDDAHPMQLVGGHEDAVLLPGLKEFDLQFLAKLLVRLRANALYESGQMFRRKLQSLPK